MSRELETNYDITGVNNTSEPLGFVLEPVESLGYQYNTEGTTCACVQCYQMTCVVINNEDLAL